MKTQAIITVLVSLLIGACASTKLNTTMNAATPSLCQLPGESLSALVIWRPRWRLEQKDAPLRELVAQQGIEKYFSNSNCYSTTHFLKADDGHDMSDEAAALNIARAHLSRPSRVLIITVRELGPFLKIRLAPVFVMGGTEVVFDISALNVVTGQSMDHFRTQWQNGGAFVIKGAASLEQDMQSALESVLQKTPVM